MSSTAAERAVVALNSLKRKHDYGTEMAPVVLDESLPNIDSLLTVRHTTELALLGYTVVEGVLPAALCAELHNDLLDEMALRGVNWRDHRVRRSVAPQVHGIVQHLEIGHCQPIWSIRQNERVARVNEMLYHDNDLLSSFDGMCLWRADDVDDGKKWWHVDQCFGRPGLRCVQSYVNLTQCAGGLAVLPGSHLQHSELARCLPRAATEKKDWFKFTPEEFTTALGLCKTQPQRVLGGVGSMVLWDSRTIHMAQMASAADPMSLRERCVVYTCMQPRAWLPNARALTKKVNAFNQHRMTTHWAASKIELFPRQWRTWGLPQAAHDPSPAERTRVETPRMLELAGKTTLKTRVRSHDTPVLKFVTH